jgi:anti-sigma regulatory factor (Ser/Thr protein kinase)
MRVHIPNTAFLGNINNFLSYFDSSKPNKLEITANKKWISAHPLILAIIGALGRSVDSKNISCEPLVATSGHYLTRMGLFDFIGIDDPVIKDIKAHEPAGRMIPLRAIKDQNDLNEFLEELVPLLHLQAVPRHVKAIQHIFSELIRNVLEHARTEHGAVVCAQYFKKSNKIGIGIADTGIGLKKSITKSYKVKDDLHAIQLALTPGITGTTNKPGGSIENGGFGLFLIKSIAYVNGDYFNIISGDKMYKLLKRVKRENEGKIINLNSNPLEERYSTIDISPWQGVAVGVDISLSNTEEFDSLLTYIYRFYSKSVKEKKRRRYKKPKFI